MPEVLMPSQFNGGGTVAACRSSVFHVDGAGIVNVEGLQLLAQVGQDINFISMGSIQFYFHLRRSFSLIFALPTPRVAMLRVCSILDCILL